LYGSNVFAVKVAVATAVHWRALALTVQHGALALLAGACVLERHVLPAAQVPTVLERALEHTVDSSAMELRVEIAALEPIVLKSVLADIAGYFAKELFVPEGAME
jgi:hypothetical protein